EAERAFLNGMGGGCQSPVAAHAEVRHEKIEMRGLSFGDGTQYSEATVTGELNESQALGQALADEVKAKL
ncbi:MAG TPA: hydroxymethylbilane synthase, partial [Verrucomicrobiota bacterium]|nr:hydroxymethylbilane synthase [Verrucomicrobiota bacterium]